MGNQWQNLSRPPLRVQALRNAVTTGPDPAWRCLDVIEETGSTNADLALRARAGEASGAVLVAEHQSAGRGRHDRRWESPARAGLAVSVLLRPAGSADSWSWLPLITGIALTDALTRTCGLAATLKWPNDVLLPVIDAPEPAKVAGLLAEVIRTDSAEPGQAGLAVVVGFGLNVSQTKAELPVPTATSLALAGAAVTDRDTVLRAVLRALADRYRQFEAGNLADLIATYRERCATIGRQIQVQLPAGKVLTGLADGVDDEGRLLVRAESSGLVQALSAGDVVHIRPAEQA